MSVLDVRPPTRNEERQVAARVVAVILNWNAWRDTLACLESLLDSGLVPRRIVICDNGSADDSIARIKAWGRGRDDFASFGSPEEALHGAGTSASIVLLELPYNGGYAYGNNIGMRYAVERAGAEFVWILNNDTVVERDALVRMLEVADGHPGVGMVGAQLLRHDAPDRISGDGRRLHHPGSLPRHAARRRKKSVAGGGGAHSARPSGRRQPSRARPCRARRRLHRRNVFSLS